MSDSVDSLASCCRLRNELADNTFSYSLGAGVRWFSTVITLNESISADAILDTSISISKVLLLVSTPMATKAIYDYIDAGLPAYKQV